MQMSHNQTNVHEKKPYLCADDSKQNKVKRSMLNAALYSLVNDSSVNL